MRASRCCRAGDFRGWLGALGMAASLVGAAADAAFLPPVEGRSQMVVTSHRLASEVGAAILDRGGNAIDAAVAVGYALAVVHPCCGNLGGGGFMTIHLAEPPRDLFLPRPLSSPRLAPRELFLPRPTSTPRIPLN